MSAVLYVIAVGFTVAGMIHALHLALVVNGPQAQAENATVLRFTTPADRAWSFTVCTLAGPYLLVRYALQFWRQDQVPPSAVGIAAVLATVWSFCSGVVFVELAILSGLLSV